MGLAQYTSTVLVTAIKTAQEKFWSLTALITWQREGSLNYLFIFRYDISDPFLNFKQLD